jgi:hypothetical protein
MGQDDGSCRTEHGGLNLRAPDDDPKEPLPAQGRGESAGAACSRVRSPTERDPAATAAGAGAAL